MKQYTSLWLVCLLAVFSMTARAQEGIETKARPDYPALPLVDFRGSRGRICLLIDLGGR